MGRPLILDSRPSVVTSSSAIIKWQIVGELRFRF
jgi:hypothetical protein